MKTVRYNPDHVPPTWFGIDPSGSNDVILVVKDEDFAFCQEVTAGYSLVPLEELAALIEYTRLSWEGIERDRHRSELRKILEAGAVIQKIKVMTSKGSFELSDKATIEYIDQRFNGRPTKDLFNKLIAELWTYFDYTVGLTKYQTPVLIGYLCAYCGVYKFEDKRLQTRPEFDANPATNHVTYKTYLKNNVRSWMNTINKNTGFND